MTAAHSIDLPAVLAERLTATHPDVLRELLTTFIHTLMGAVPNAPTPETATGTTNSTSAQAVWISRSQSCATVPTSRTGCCNAANAPSGPSPPWLPPVTCSECPPGR